MGLLSKLRGRPSTTSTALALHASGTVEVVGESYRQDVLRRLATTTTDCAPYLEELSGSALKQAQSDTTLRWFRAALVRESENEYDENAIAVYADAVGRVGYLNRDDAMDYQPVFAELQRHGCSIGGCPAFLIGGQPGKPSFGVILCLSEPDEIVRDLNEPESGT